MVANELALDGTNVSAGHIMDLIIVEYSDFSTRWVDSFLDGLIHV